MIPVNLQSVPVEIETLGPWRLDGQVVKTGTVVSVLPSLAADLIARGKARRYVAPVAPAPVVEPDAVPQPDPETPPAPTPVARGKK